MTKWRSFKQAKKYVDSQKLDNRREWIEYCKSGKKPDDIPASPAGTYKEEWQGWGDWLGTGTISVNDRKFRSFVDAKKFAQKLRINSQTQWKKYDKTKFPKDIPSDPSRVYKKEWTGWGDFLGTGRVGNKDRKYRSYKDAKKFARSLKFNGAHEWKIYAKSGKKPYNIPADPQKSYKEFTTWGDFLGTGNIANQNRKFRSYDKTKKFAQSQNVKSISEWRTFCKSGKKPEDIPSNPQETYKKEWKGWGDFLGTGIIAQSQIAKTYLSWKEAKPIYRKLAKQYGLQNRADWKRFVKTHKKLLDKLHIPVNPQVIYTKERVWSKMKNE